MKTKVIAVPTEEIRRIVQEKLFELGYKWYWGGKNYSDFSSITDNSENTYIAFYNDKILTGNYRKHYLEEYKDKFEEITMWDLYQMEPIKDTVKLTSEKGEIIEISKKSLEGLKKLK